jgi:MarR family transcriptional regulator for hemolysin
MLLRVSDIWRRYDRVYSDWAQRHGLSTNAMTLIEEMFIRPDGIEPAEAADYLAIPRQTMTSTLDALESRGMLERLPHESDRRRKVVKFTEEGRKAAEELVNELHEWEMRAIAGLDKGERRSVFEALRKLCDDLEGSLPEKVRPARKQSGKR